MSAKTSQKLADALRAKGFEDLAKRAEADEFHDFLSIHPDPAMQLMDELTKLGDKELIDRHLSGDFDASVKESDEWWEKEGEALALGMLGPDMMEMFKKK